MKKNLSLSNIIKHYASHITVLLAFSLSTLAFSLFVTFAFAEEKTVSLEEIVVTATRTEKELVSVPASVSVVTKEEIEKKNVKTVDEALNTLSGVFNRRGKGLMDTLSSVTLDSVTSFLQIFHAPQEWDAHSWPFLFLKLR